MAVRNHRDENAFLTIILVLLTILLLLVSNGKYARKRNTAVAIEAAHVLAMGGVMFICQAVFRS